VSLAGQSIQLLLSKYVIILVSFPYLNAHTYKFAMGMDLSLMCNTFIYIGSAAQKVGNKSSLAGPVPRYSLLCFSRFKPMVFSGD
jgi:hypothetical protein